MLGNDYLYKGCIDNTDTQYGPFGATTQVDTISLDGAAGGSYIVPLANALASVVSNLTYVPCANGSTTIADWQPGADHQDRTTLYGSMIYRALQAQTAGGTLKVVLLHLGESDVIAGTSQAAFLSGLTTFANTVFADLGIKVMVCKLQNMSTYLGGYDNTNVNAAIAQAWAAGGNILQGPDFSDLTPSVDGLHWTTDAELLEAANRWYSRIVAELYS